MRQRYTTRHKGLENACLPKNLACLIENQDSISILDALLLRILGVDEDRILECLTRPSVVVEIGMRAPQIVRLIHDERVIAFLLPLKVAEALLISCHVVGRIRLEWFFGVANRVNLICFRLAVDLHFPTGSIAWISFGILDKLLVRDMRQIVIGTPRHRIDTALEEFLQRDDALLRRSVNTPGIDILLSNSNKCLVGHSVIIHHRGTSEFIVIRLDVADGEYFFRIQTQALHDFGMDPRFILVLVHGENNGLQC